MPSKITKSDRAIAISVLMDVLDNGAFANIALRKAFNEVDIPPQSRAFVTDIVNETLRNLMQIDYILNQFSKTQVQDMKPLICYILRVGVCQIKFMPKIPDRAAVNEAVLLTKAYGFETLSGYVNGVLRTIIREEVEDVPALKYSYPGWLMEKIVTWLGEDVAQEFYTNSHKPPPVIAWANPQKVTPAKMLEIFEAENVDATPLPNSLHPFFVLRQIGDMTRLNSFKDGLFSILDPGAMLAVDGVDPMPGQVIIDLCAAPGGKTFAIAAQMQGRGSVLAFDIHQHRIELIRQTRKRLDIPIVKAALGDALIYDPELDSIADTVLLDAPCSGLGTIRKHPEIKYTRTLQDIEDLAAKQREMLLVACRYVKPGGKLVYCTCTIAREENRGSIVHFLTSQQGKDFTLVSQEQTLPTEVSDGFYVAILKRNE